MTNAYAKAYTEVLEILRYFSEEEYSKIPTEKIEFYKNNMDKNYFYTINPQIDLSKQYISKEANAILISLFRDYFATNKQKNTLENLLKQNERRLEQIKKENYNPENLFKYKKQEISKDTSNTMQLIQYKQSYFKKFTNFIKKLLNHKN